MTPSEFALPDSSSAPALGYPEWQRPYQAALLELDHEKLSARVAEAEAAIFERLQALDGTQDAQAERHALQDAINGLKVIKRDSLNFPDWQSESRGS